MSQHSVWQQILDYSGRADPYPLYAELRRTPVVRAEDGSYVVSTYQEIVDLLHDPRLSSDLRNLPEQGTDTPAQASEEDFSGLPPTVIEIDSPDHDRIRRLLTWNYGPPHRPGRIDSMIPGMLDIVTSEIDNFAGQDGPGTTRVDIVDDFAYPFPVTVICRLLAVPREDEPRFQALSDAVIKAADPTTGGFPERQRRRAKATAALGHYFAHLIHPPPPKPAPNLPPALLTAP